MRRIKAVWMLGLRRGRVTFRNRTQGVAPKTSAASCSSLGMSWRPATRMTRTKGVARQTSAATTARKRAVGCS